VWLRCFEGMGRISGIGVGLLRRHVKSQLRYKVEHLRQS
jgi:hypothetical protein